MSYINREEAIRLIMEYQGGAMDKPTARKVLENMDGVKICEDTISRRAAIDALDSINCFGWVEDSWAKVSGIIEHVSAAQPERKRGEWLEHYAHEDGKRDGVWCSECREHYYFGGQLMNFCPNCGADMRGEQDEVD